MSNEIWSCRYDIIREQITSSFRDSCHPLHGDGKVDFLFYSFSRLKFLSNDKLFELSRWLRLKVDQFKSYAEQAHVKVALLTRVMVTFTSLAYQISTFHKQNLPVIREHTYTWHPVLPFVEFCTLPSSCF